MNLGMSEMIFIFLLALIIFGPRKLPEIGREVGKALAELKRASNEFKSQLENEIEQVNVEEERKKFESDLKEAEADGNKNIALAFQMYLTDYDALPPFISDSTYNDVHDLLLKANAYKDELARFA